MKEYILIPVYKNRISPLFDVSKYFYKVNRDDGRYNKQEISLEDGSLPQRIEYISRMEINLVICSAISRNYFSALNAAGINVIAGVIGDADEVIEAYLNSQLEKDCFLMPGCRGRGRIRNRKRGCRRFIE